MQEEIVYFEKGGREHTEIVLELVKKKAMTRGISKIVLASTRGATARAAAEVLEGTNLQMVVVPWQYGFAEKQGVPQQPFPTDLIPELQAKGHRVHFGTMLFHTEELYGTQTPRVIANTLRIFSEGIKVCVEIIMMATDGGWLAKGEQVIAVAGTGAGADTAVIALAAPSTKMNTLRIQEILCKPL